MFRKFLVVGLLFATAASGQSSVSTSSNPASAPTREELAQVRVRYAVAVREGYERDDGPGLSYSGVTPNDLGLALWLWLPAFDHLGLTGGLQREAFSLNDGATVVTSGGLLRASVGPTGRVRLGPVRLELAAEYAFHQLPQFSTLAPAFSASGRHGALLAARVLVDAGPLTIEARGEGLAGVATVGGQARASEGYGVGGALRLQLFATGPVRWGLAADVQWQRDLIHGPDAAPTQSLGQAVLRAGGGLDLQWKDPAPQATTGGLAVLVHGPPAAKVTVEGLEHASASGRVELDGLSPGPKPVTVQAGGFVAQSLSAEVRAGETTKLEVTLQPEGPRVGSLLVTVHSIDGDAPVQATLQLAGRTLATDARGQAQLEGLPAGAVSVKATAPGFVAGEEAAAVVAGGSSELTITLVPEKKVLPATLSGHVRGARGGKPIAASLQIKELHQSIEADEAGAFSLQVPAGTYTVRILATGYFGQTKSVTVKEGEQAIFNVDLTPK